MWCCFPPLEGDETISMVTDGGHTFLEKKVWDMHACTTPSTNMPTLFFSISIQLTMVFYKNSNLHKATSLATHNDFEMHVF